VRELLTIDKALACVLEHSQPLPPETVPLAHAAGRVLVEQAVAVVDLPPFPSSAMDGFAVRAAETPGTLPVAFRVAAGTPAPGPLPEGSAAGIATGGAVPDGADTVVPVELTVEQDSRVELAEAARPGMHIRPRGGDVRAGTSVVDAGTRLGPAQIGALSAAGIADVRCGRKPRVSVLATGSELRSPGETLEPGQIFESNRTMLAAALAGTGAVLEIQPVVGDDVDLHRAALSSAFECDVVVTSGGVSMGPHDLVRRVEAELGVDELFWGVAVKPGKPLSFGVRDRTLVFGLPGNPVSSLVGALLFVRPALLALQGASEPGPDYDVGEAGAPLRRNPHRDEFARARRRVEPDRVLLEPVAGQESHMIVRAATADAIVHVPRGEGEIAAGAPARYLKLA
jgi:molybdopterin molybdotransferase